MLIYKKFMYWSRFETRNISFQSFSFKRTIPPMPDEQKLRILYDGNCPLCGNRIAHLRRIDKTGNLECINFRETHFDWSSVPVARAELESQIYAITSDGTLISGMDVVRSAYRAAGRGWIAAPTGWPVFRPVFDHLYMFIARNRMRISRFF
jgi:predicted DCC family thiol-disulfide oxidoreductase YuxK